MEFASDAFDTTAIRNWDAEDTQFLFDGNGNVIRIVESGVAKFDTIEYDHRNLPTRIVKGDGTEITYHYNASGQRIYKQVASQTPEHYILDGDQTVAVVKNGVVSRRDPVGRVLVYSDQWCSRQAHS